MKHFFIVIFLTTNSFFFNITAGKPDTLFMSEEIMEIELRADFAQIEMERLGTPEYHEGKLTYIEPDGSAIDIPVRVMARGNFRMNPANCNFPPLAINFNGKSSKNTLFEGQGRIKLVTPCQGDDDVVDEYLVYKLYNLVTDISLKVRLARILYIDSSTDRKLFKRYSYFIEDVDHMAERNGATEFDKFMTPYHMQQDNVGLMTVFQYLIGNKEWFIPPRHNVVIIQPDDTLQKPLVVPYDFDFSGFVDAYYTKPRGVPDSLLSNRRDYKGPCFSDDEYSTIFNRFRELRPAFEKEINRQTIISPYRRKLHIEYLNFFYNVISNKDLIEREFKNSCESKADYNYQD